MLQISENEVSVHLCTFQANFLKAIVNLRFPSCFFVEWKAINNKNSVSTVGRKKAVNSLIELDQALTFSTEMIYHRIQKQYLKKQSLIHLNLISNSRPDQIKLVGRVIIDLAEVANKNSFADVTTLKLMYCSVDAELTFKIKFIRSIQSNLELNQLDKSAFSDLYSFTSPKIGHKNRLEYRESLSERRSEDERRRLPRGGDREDFANSRVARATSPKVQKILIKQAIEQPLQTDHTRSLPISEKKSVKDYNEIKTEQRKAKAVVEIPESGAQQLETFKMKQRNLLEKQLEEHKERIKKLQNEIKAALKMFEQSQTMSEMNRSKLIESEHTIHQLIDKEIKIKADYEKRLAASHEEHQRQISVIKNGYEADIKLLQATMEVERAKLVELEKSSKNLMNNYQQAKNKVKEQQLLLLSAESSKNEIDALKIEKQQLLLRLGNKQTDKLELQPVGRKNQQQLAKVKAQFQEELSRINVLLKTKQENILSLHNINQNLRSQLNTLQEQNLQLMNRVQMQQQGRKNAVQSSDKASALANKIGQLQSLLQSQVAKIDAMRQSAQQQLLSVKSLNQQLRAQNQNFKQIIQKLTEQQPKINQQLSQNVVLPNDQLETLRKTNQQLKHSLELQNQENTSLRRQLQSLTQLIASKEQQAIKLNQEIARLKQPITTKKTVQSQKVLMQQMVLNNNPQVKITPEKRQQPQQIQEYTIQVNIPADQHDLNLNFDFLSNNLNKSAEPSEEDRHRFHFENHGSPLTKEDVNQISMKINTDRSMNNSKDQNTKLKEEIQQLKQLAAPKQGQAAHYLKEKQNLMSAHSATVLQLQHERDSLNQQLISLNEQIKVLTERPAVEVSDVKTINQNNFIQNQKLQECKRIITQQNQKHQSLQSKIYQLEGLLSKNNKDQRYIQELEERLAGLQEQLKIKDQLLCQSERNMEESYAIKYQLSDLKQKIVQLKSALAQRDTYINQLEEATQHLAKELEQTTSKKNENFELKLQKVENQSTHPTNQVNNTQVNNNQIIVNQLNSEIAYLKGQIEELNRQLIVYNNESTELKNRIQDYKNEKTQMESRLQLVKIKITEYQTVMIQLRAQKQKLQVELNEQRAKQEQNRQRINEQIGSLTGKLVEMENNLGAIPDNETELTELRHAVQVISSEKNGLNEELLKQIEISKQLSSQIQSLNGSISQLQTVNSDLSANLNKVQNELLSQMDHSQKLQTQLQSIKANNASVNKMNSSLKGQLQEVNSRIEQLKKETEQIGQQKQKVQQQKVSKNELDIEITIHKVDSTASEAPAIVYEKSVIEADQANLIKKQSSNKEQLEKVIEENKRLKEDNKLLYEDNQKFKRQVESLSQNVDRTNKQMEKILSELAHENQQKFFYFNELENSKALVQKLQKQIKALNKKNQRINMLPLQSFDTNHLLRIKHHPQAITEEQKLKQPSISQQIQVQAQPETIPHNQESRPTLESKKAAEGKTQVQTNITEQSCVALMRRDLQLARQELEKEKKEHRLLQQIDRVGIQKYEMLTARYQSCLNQLEYVRGEVDRTVRDKQIIEEDFYRSKVVVQNLNEQIAKIVEENQQLTELLIAQQNKQPVIAVNQLNQSPKEQQIKVVKIQQQNPIVSAPAQNQATQITQRFELLRIEYENRIAELLKSQQQYKNKAALLQQNLQNLQKMLQEQIQVNQNQDINSHRIPSNTQTALKLSDKKSEENINTPAEFKIHQDIKPQFIEVHTVQVKSENVQTPVKSEVVPQNDALLVQIEQLRRQKIQNLQKLYSLEQKLNEVQIIKTAIQQQHEQELNLRLHEIQQLRFAYEQISKEYQEDETKQQIRKQSMKVKYQEAQNQIRRLNKNIAKFVESTKQLQTEIADLKNNINVLQQEKRNNAGADQLNDELQKVKMQLQNKVVQLGQLIVQKAEAVQQISVMNDQITTMTNQITEMKSLLQTRKQQRVQKEEQLRSLGHLYAQITSQKQAIEKKLKLLEQKNTRIEQQLSILKNRSESKDQKMASLRKELNQAEKKVNAINARIKVKEEQALAFAKENHQLKISNTAHEQKIKLLDQKEKQIKETVAQLELQSRKIVEYIKQTLVSEANYYKKYIQKEKECSSLSAAAAQFQQSIANKERELVLERQIATQLRNELDVLKNGAGAQEFPQILTIQIEKYNQLKDAHEKLINVNKEYLENIAKKSTINSQNQRLKQQLKYLTISLNESNAMLNQIKAEYQRQKIECTNSLSKLQASLATQSQKALDLNKQLSIIKENKVAGQQKYYENLIAQKNKEIESLRKEIIEARSKKESEIKQESKMTPYQLDILNEQIYSLNNDILEKERQITQLKKELDQFKQIQSPPKQKIIESTPFKRVTSQVQTENNIIQIEKHVNHVESNFIKSAPPEPQANNQNVNTAAQPLHIICEKIKQLYSNRKSNNKQGLFEAFIKKYDQIQQQFLYIGLETTQIQQKARYISKELQKLKAYIIKSQNRAFKQKTEILALIKPCEHTANQLISLSETLNECDSNAFL